MYKSEELETVLTHRLNKGNNADTKSSHIQHSQDNTSAMMSSDNDTTSSKPNQVGTVLLYGVPIVSLYIEAQERLCLAQISNTLLKQFSYNEIHNRRVALGITCVQCTPVQLEILRRAGAMPVSSRRCGMITRREAERLCKSFLGDNAPPRLPEDFSFSVYHECAWGCRGQFLPARYNSSRAKCIKCSYCGLFFSPNKFIFHSHRIGPSDKYIQPDAANFNSWRRHMKLNGVSPDEIVYAWEDVKAMFNGGTRKRLVSSITSASSANVSSPESVTATPLSEQSNGSSNHINHKSYLPENNTTKNAQKYKHSPSYGDNERSPKRLKDSAAVEKQSQPLSPPLMQAAVVAAVAAAANAGHQYPVRPVNVHSAKINSNCSRLMNTPSLCSNPIPRNVNALSSDLTLSRNFVMDYMWHTHHQQHQSGYTLPWLKQPTAQIFFNPHQTFHHAQQQNSLSSVSPTDTDNDKNSTLRRNSCERIVPPTNLPYYKSSAFKPVLGTHRSPLFNDHLFSSSVLGSSLPPEPNSRLDDATVSIDNDLKSRNKRYYRRHSENNPEHIADTREHIVNVSADNLSSDDEMVDIETTEDQTVEQSIQRSTSNHSLVEENGGHTTDATNNGQTSDSESIRNFVVDDCASHSNNNNNINNNNNFLSINNNSIDKGYATDLNGGGAMIKSASKKCDDYAVNKTCVNVRNVKCNTTSDVLAKPTIISSENIDNNIFDCNIDAQSTKSNESTDIDVEIQDKDEPKTVGSGGGAGSSSAIQMNDHPTHWTNATDKSAKDPAQPMNYVNRDEDAVNSQSYDMNGLNMISSNLEKKHGYRLHKTDELVARSLAAKSTITGYGNKTDDEPSDFKYNSIQTAPQYDKIDLKWHSSQAPSPTDAKSGKSPLQSRPSPLSSFGPFPRLTQLYTRPSQLPFHLHTQHHSLSKHFHQMLNQHTTFLQNSTTPIDRAVGSLDFSSNIDPETVQSHSHQTLG